MSDHNLSDRTRSLLASAREEAVRFHHDFVGTEHILLGALRDEGLAEYFLGIGAARDAARERLERALRPGNASTAAHDLNYRSGAKKVLDHAAVAAKDEGAATVEPEHVLAALLRERRGPSFQALKEAGAHFDQARPEQPPPKPEASVPPPAPKRGGERPPREPRPRRERPERERAERPQQAAAVKAPPPEPAHAVEAPDEPPRERGVRAAVLRQRDPILTWRNLLLLALPASIALNLVQAQPLLVFSIACVGVLPLAGYMGEATEHLAHRTGPTVGGFLNATFGNAAELIIAIAALRAGLVDLVKASITGSILGNLLLILGLSLMAGGAAKPVLRFNRTAAGMSAAMLVLAVVGLVMPAIFHHLHPSEAVQELHLSEGVAIVLAITYLCSLLFSLKTHRDIFHSEEHAVGASPWNVGKSMTVLALATVGVAVESEILVHATTAVTATLGLSELFLGLIVIPIIGNAAEHATAVVVARRGKTDLALGIALGSSTQVALLVAPVLVLAGVLMGQNMNLVFSPFEVAALGLSTLVAAIITLDGESHWFEGVQLVAVYALVALTAFFL